MKNKYCFQLLFMLPLICLYRNSPGQGTWKNYTVTDGLADNDARALYCKGNGEIWIGTLDGASTYDGSAWQTYRPGSFVETITEDINQHIWLSVDDEGIYVFDGSNWINHNVTNGMSGNDILSIRQDHQNNMWASSWGQGVDRYDGTNWINFNRSGVGLGADIVNDIEVGTDGSVWFGCQRDLFFGEPGGLTKFDGNTWTSFTSADGLANDNVNVLYADDNGDIWAGTDEGISVYDGTDWTNYSTDDGLVNNRVFSILKDVHGNFWIGTLGGGISHFDGTNWTTYDSNDGLISDRVFDGVEDKKGHLWFATSDGVSEFIPAWVGNKENEALVKKLAVYPMPFADQINISYVLVENMDEVRYSLTDLLGRNLYTVALGFQNSGNHQFELNVTGIGLSPGYYIFSIYDGDRQMATKKLMNGN